MVIDKIKKRSMPKPEIKDSKVDIPVGKWVKCSKCNEILYKDFLHENFSVCPNCNYHFRLSSRRRIWQIVDDGTFNAFDYNISTVNPLKMEDYAVKLKGFKERTGIDEAVICGTRRNRRQRSCFMRYGWKLFDGKHGNCCWRKDNIFNGKSNRT